MWVLELLRLLIFDISAKSVRFYLNFKDCDIFFIELRQRQTHPNLSVQLFRQHFVLATAINDERQDRDSRLELR